MTGVPAENRTEHVANTGLQLYLSTNVENMFHLQTCIETVNMLQSVLNGKGKNFVSG
jgi:hypothetical protein